MSAQLMQSILGSLFSLVFLLVNHRLGRKQQLSFRYTVGWLLLSAFGVMAGIVIPVITPIANLLAITPAALLAIGGIILLVVICVQLSISISGLHERQRRLTEELAHLRQTVDTIDRDQT